MEDYGGIVVPQNASPRGPIDEGNPAPFWDVVGAGWRKRTVEADTWRYRDGLRSELTRDLYDRLEPASQQKVEAQMLGRRFVDPPSAWQGLVLDQVTAERQANPDKWKDAPADAVEAEDRITARRQAELKEAQDILDLPGGGFAEFLGAAGRDIVDPINIALMPFGLHGGALRVIAGEAALGAVSEGLSVPREMTVASDLGLPDPSLAGRMAEGALFGGAIGGLVHGAGRFISYLTGQREAVKDVLPPGKTAQEADADVRAAYNELTGTEPPTQIMADKAARPGAPGQAPTLADFDFSLTGNASPKSNRVGYVFGKLVDAGIEPHIAAGFVGNFMVESGPGLHTSAVGDGGSALGLAQWNDRRPALIEFARKRGKQPTDLDTQIAFVLHELQGSEAAAWSRIRNAKTSEEAAALISQYYERPGVPHMSRRVGHAKDVFTQYSDGSIPRWTGKAPPPEADAPVFTTSRGFTRDGQVTAGESRIDVGYEVADAALLRRATGDLQPRDRSRAASDEQIAEIAARLDPARLMPAPEADRGAPVVGPDGVIESGNGRVMAIRRAYERHPDRAEAYRAAIEAAGFEIPEGVKEPVLIARRRSELDPAARRQFVREANNATVARMSPTERSAADAAALSERALALYAPGRPLTGPENRDFAKAALQGLPQAERAAMVDAGGALNAEGVRRLSQALFARAWDAPDIIARFAEADAGELRSLIDALSEASPAWAGLKADIEAGIVRPDMDISPYVLDAMRMIAAAREIAQSEGKAVAGILNELLEDVDLLEGAVSPLTAALVRKFWREGRAAPKDEIAGFLSRYAAEARKVGMADAGLFGDGPGPADVLRAIDAQAFGDLPDAFGRAGRAPAVPDMSGDMPEAAFAKGADSPEAIEADQAAIEDLRSGIEADDLIGLIARGATAEEIAANPRVRKTLDEMAARPRTDQAKGYGTDSFWAAREYRAGEKILLGRSAAEDYVWAEARRLAWTDEGFDPPASIRHDRKAVLLIGAPASGKSSIANPWARRLEAAIVDADEAKKIIPEFDGGVGANAVHEESSEIVDHVLARALSEGANLVLPKVGARPGSIEGLSRILRDRGYHVTVALVEVAPDEAWRRMIGRYVQTGRIIPPEIMQAGIDGAPRTYQILKEKGVADDYAKIDNSPAQGQPRQIVEGSPDLASAFGGRDGGDGPGAPRSNTRPAAKSGRQYLDPNPEPDPVALLAAARAEFGELTIRLDDGSEISASALLDDIEADEELAQVLKLCNIGGASE